ncbi:MAG TPA: hypothetical protein DD435_12730 [Cyanobacteria bacterium UBA8530]|nr:hypothetical protein [Cyanobacteria bacterium UBA8530]
MLAAEDLSLISIWNPTFLTLLLQPLGEGLSRICEDLAGGKISLSLPEEIRSELEKALGVQPRRAREIREIFEEKRDSPELFGSLWPHLALISCWTEASAYGPFLELEKKFPGVRIQPKGLLATEGIVTFPLLNHGAALCLRSHFFEFLPEQGKKTLPAWEIVEGGVYSLVMTTGGGLYRYSLGDQVEVIGFYQKCPLLRFLGKDSKVSDLFGEKLNEAHVAEVLTKKFENLERPSFSLLAPAGEPPDRYLLYLAGERRFSPEEMTRASRLLEEGLKENVHYAYCRTLGQLKEAEIRWVEGGAARAFGIYQEVCLERGQKAGDIKSSFLDKQPVWSSRFLLV